MHGIELGTLKYMFQEFEKILSQNTLNLINEAISKIHKKFSKLELVTTITSASHMVQFSERQIRAPNLI